MSTPYRPSTVRLLQLVDEGVTERDEAMRRTIPWVPPGTAFRVRASHNAAMRAKYAARYGSTPAGPRPDPCAYEVHRRGAMRVLQKTLNSLLQRGTLEYVDGHLRRPNGEVGHD